MPTAGTFSAIPVPETTIGIAKEVTRGTPVAPAYYIPVMSPAYKPDRQYLPDESLQGSMVGIYDEIPGLRYDAHGWDQHLYMDSLPLIVQGVLGSADTKTVAPANTTLSSSAAAGATSISTAASIPAGSYVVIANGSPGTIETHITGTPSTSGPPYTIPLLFPLIYAQASAATVTGLTKHQFSLLNNSPSTGNQPPSFTLTDFGGETNWRQLTSGQLDGVNITGAADALPKAAIKWFCDPAITPTAPTPSFTTAESPPGWTAQLLLGGTAVPYVVSWEWAMQRGVKPIPAITGTQQYWQYFASVLAATAKFTVLEDMAATWLTAYTSGTTETVDLTVYDIQNGWAMNLHSSKAKIITGSLERGSKEWVEVPLELQLLPTSTDALAGGVSPCIVTVANAVTTTY